jgi:hypothetical protein
MAGAEICRQVVAEDDYGRLTNAKKHVLEVLPGVSDAKIS